MLDANMLCVWSRCNVVRSQVAVFCACHLSGIVFAFVFPATVVVIVVVVLLG